MTFYQLLEEVRIFNITSQTWKLEYINTLQHAIQNSTFQQSNPQSTHSSIPPILLGFKETAQQIFTITSTDFVNSNQWDLFLSHYKNLILWTMCWGSIIDIDVYNHTHYFTINENNSKHPIPVAKFGLTLPKVSLALDGNIFSPVKRMSLSADVLHGIISPWQTDFHSRSRRHFRISRLYTVATTNPEKF